MLIDTHCHLLDPSIGDIDLVVDEALEAGVEIIVCPMTELTEWDEAKALAERRKEVYVLAGIHPEELSTAGPLAEEMRRLETILKHDKVKGIGEIGLDFYRDKERRSEKKQLEFFRAQMELASDLGMPVAIHMREAQGEMLSVLKSLKKIPTGQFHCFAGDEAFLYEILEMGFYVSFCGNITYKSAGDLRDLVKKVPKDRLLLETDSPYLPPEPKRGKVNTPENVKITAQFIAGLRGESFEELAKNTTKNALCLLSLDT